MFYRISGPFTVLCLFLCLVSAQVLAGTTSGQNNNFDPGIFNKDTLTIAVTDSGLGGLSVVADAVEKLRQYKGFKQVNLIFFNALFSNKGGYNSLTRRSEKVAVFNAALESLEKKYAPDIILIACNTLSVIYPDTRFAAETTTPVKGIVDNGVDLVNARLSEDGNSRAILFATQTTVTEGLHKEKLINSGIRADRIVYQACPELTLFIEQGYDSPETGMLIQAYVDEALDSVGDGKSPLFASFNCTHYGYSKNLWQQAFNAVGIKVMGFLDPNTRMIDSLLHPESKNRFQDTALDVRMVSMVDIPEASIRSIGRYLAPISPETLAALAGFELKQDLFDWQNLVSNRME